MTDLTELAKQQAAEIASAGHNGWGNTMLELAAALETTQEQLDWVVRENDRLLAEGRELTTRAEQLAEALREMREYVTAALQAEREAFAGHEDCSDIVGIEADLHKINALLELDGDCDGIHPEQADATIDAATRKESRQ